MKTEKRIYLIRHAETIFNSNQIDDIDTDLTELGVLQSEGLGLKLKEIEFDYVIISKLKRTQKTFFFSKIKYKQKEISELCREFKINKSDFLEGEDIIFETQAEFLDRIIQFKQYLIGLNYSNIAVFTHSDFIYEYTKTEKQGEGIDLGNAEYKIIYS